MRNSLTKTSLAFVGGMAALFGASEAAARRISVDQTLNPTLIRFGLDLPAGSGCVGNVCQVTLPYAVNFGAATTNQIFVYNSGLVSLGAPLPASAFSSALPSIPNFFAASSYNIIAAGYSPDDAGAPATLTGGVTGISTAAVIRDYARNNMRFCKITPTASDGLICPAGFDPNNLPSDIEPFIDPFIAANDFGRFEDDINIQLGSLSYLVFNKPADGFVDVELFQYYQFGVTFPSVYVGMKNDLAETTFEGADGRVFKYRFALANSGVPEPSTWLMMIAGFGMIGGALRRRNVRTSVSYA